MVTPQSPVQPLDATRCSDARWLVLAPHADDETLGAGALIAEAAGKDGLAGVVYLTDGGGSHPHADQGSRQRLVTTRRLEASLALRRLAGHRHCPALFLDWPDAQPFCAGEEAFDVTVSRLVALCEERAVDALAVTAMHEPHCDHVAACELAYAVAARSERDLVVFEYIVWADREPGKDYSAYSTASMSADRRAAALMAHRSQLTAAPGEGFRLPAHMLRMDPYDVLYARHRVDA